MYYLNKFLLKYLIYLSTASIYFNPDTLEDMLTEFRALNAAEEITGVLLYNYGQFLQFIEGSNKAINKLIKKIEKDKRHHSLVILETGPLTERVFPDWSMSYRDISHVMINNNEGYADALTLQLFTPLQLAHPLTSHLTAFVSKLRKSG
ncbi:MAG: BLUF domain-containing protein [Sphingobacteriaceae bacterium]|nr:MAG: BLUF domain-containing protein [Sphingobacteriaceae bacterium]